MRRCLLLGEPLAGGVQVVGKPWRMSLQTADAHGNVRAHGGEIVEVETQVGVFSLGLDDNLLQTSGNVCEHYIQRASQVMS
jgi:hypothetical protein